MSFSGSVRSFRFVCPLLAARVRREMRDDICKLSCVGQESSVVLVAMNKQYLLRRYWRSRLLKWWSKSRSSQIFIVRQASETLLYCCHHPHICTFECLKASAVISRIVLQRMSKDYFVNLTLESLLVTTILLIGFCLESYWVCCPAPPRLVTGSTYLSCSATTPHCVRLTV